jgi:hypothetical protein
MAKPKKKAAAIVTIRRAQDMTAKGRRDIASWLRMHANHILKHGGNYSPRFTGRFTYI